MNQLRRPGFNLARTSTRFATATAVLTLAALGLGACADDDRAATSSAEQRVAQNTDGARRASLGEGRQLVGKVQGTDANIAISIGAGRAHGYVCDSKKIAGFLVGSATDGRLRLTSARGYAVQATVEGDRLVGTVTLRNGSRHRFTAEPARDDAGLYELTKKLGGTSYLTRWVRTNDGDVRGKTTIPASGEAAGPDATTQATDGAGSDGVPPSAEPTPEPKNFGDMTCEELQIEFNRLESERLKIKYKTTKLAAAFRKSAAALIEKQQHQIIDEANAREPEGSCQIFAASADATP